MAAQDILTILEQVESGKLSARDGGYLLSVRAQRVRPQRYGALDVASFQNPADIVGRVLLGEQRFEKCGDEIGRAHV